MGKWRRYSVGQYRLQQLNGRAVVVWKDETGKRQRRLLGATEFKEGQGQLDAFVRSLEIINARQGRTVGDLWAAYRADRERDGKQVQNLDWSWLQLAPRFSTLPVDVLNADICRDYAAQRLAKVSPGTIWSELTHLRSCINWAFKRRIIERSPYVWLPAKPESKQRVLSEDEALRLLAAADRPHLKLFIILALCTGARSTAILELTWDRVHFDRGEIDLKLPRQVHPLTKEVRKARSVVPMTAELQAELHAARAGALTDHVIEWNCEPVKSIKKGFASAAAKAKLRSVTPHTLRHTAATWLTEAGIPMEIIARFIGHRDPKTTRTIYSHPSADTLRTAANVIPGKFGKR